MFQNFTLRLRPNKTQIAMFEYILDYNCETYNAALQERVEAWKLEKKSISYFDQCKELTELSKEKQFTIIANEIQRDPLDRLNKSFDDYFRRCKRGEKPGHPRFRSMQRYTSFSFGGSNQIMFRGNSIKIPKIGYLKFKTSEQIFGTVKQATVKKIGKNWIIRLCCDIGPAPERQPVSKSIGIDFGISNFLTLSNGSFIKNPRWIKNHSNRIARACRNLARKKRKSKNRIRAKERLRRIHQKVADTRRNFLHHVSKQLILSYDLIAFEKLQIIEMSKKQGFGKSIMDAAWGILIWQLTYKAEYAGKWAVPVDPRNTTKTCSQCGKIVKKEIWEREHNCECGLILDRDHNAAINILRLGRSLVGLPAE